MKTYEANSWQRVWIFFPRPVYTVVVRKDCRYVAVQWLFCCRVDRRFAVVKGVFQRVEYRKYSKNRIEDAPTHHIQIFPR